MPSRSRPIPLRQALWTSALALGLMLGFHPIAVADDERPVPPEEAGEDHDAGADLLYVADGATISWDLDARRFRAPTAEQAARLAGELRRWTQTKAGAGERPFMAEDVVVEALPDGMKKARLPLRLLNAAVLRLGPGGEGAGVCAEGPRQVHDVLRAPTPAAEEK